MKNKLVDVDISLNINADVRERITLTKEEHTLLKEYLDSNWDILQYEPDTYKPNPLWEILINKLDLSNIEFDMLEYVELENEIEYEKDNSN